MSPGFVNLRGEAVDPRASAPERLVPGTLPSAEEARAAGLGAPDLEVVFQALCLAGNDRPRTWLTLMLKNLGARHPKGRDYHGQDVAAAVRLLADVGRAEALPGLGFRVPAPVLAEWAAQSLTPALARQALPAWVATSLGRGLTAAPWPKAHFRHQEDMVALARLLLHAGFDLPAFTRHGHEVLGFAMDMPEVVMQAALSPFVPALFERMDDDLRRHLLDDWLSRGVLERPLWQPLMRWLEERLESTGAGPAHPASPVMRLALAVRRLHGGEVETALARLKPLSGPPVDAAQAVALAMLGRWAPAAEAFAAHAKAMGKAAGRRKALMRDRDLRWYLLSLLAQPDAKAWTAARKVALAETGSRRSGVEGWGLWALAAAVRLGDEPNIDTVWRWHSGWNGEGSPDNADRLVLAAWLGVAARDLTPPRVAGVLADLEAGHERVRADLVRQAAARLGLAVPVTEPARGTPWPVAFFGAPREKWRDALQAMAALAPERKAAAGGAEVEPALHWVMELDNQGRVVEIFPFERSSGARGRARLKPLTLAAVKKRPRLDPRDAAVARCIDKTWYSGSALGIDVAAAAVALVGHPGVALEPVPDRLVELREGLPELEVRRVSDPQGGEHFEFHLVDPVLSDGPPELGQRWTGRSFEAEADKRDGIRIVPDGGDRAKLIRLTAAQRRVAELVAQRWTVPVQAKAELDAALRALAGHFQLQSDATAGQSVPSDARLRAQLVPRGDALQLRLVVRPFGDFGPLLVPGRGRARAMTVHEGLELSTQRDLGAEVAHMAQVLEALPFLEEADEGDAAWLLDDPEHALTAVERLPTLPGVAALEWPRGKPVRVTPVSGASVKASLASGTDWFALDGELRVDEERVIGLQRLMSLVQESRQGRFVAIGDGEYLALTERLRAQLADLAAMGQAERDGLRLPKAAAGFLADALEGIGLDAAGDEWSARIQRLEEAATLQPEPPPGLQAELRGYQAEGYRWMMRMAHAGLGAVLADDMGLGKTVQTLALLVARAALGPALVIAPTSVCGNWVAEAARFAPGLRVRPFGEGDRAALLEDAGPGDLVVASYGLALIEGEGFAARTWSTLVLDEAQALKNAATQRAKAIGTLQADFRLALSGTPVENRLADLWSIMNLLNPGLLGSAQRFGERFAGPIERARDEAVRARLRRLVGPFLLRRTKAQVLTDLPPRTEIVLRVEPGAEERHFLEASRRTAIERIAGIETEGPQAAFQVLAELTRLRRAACDPRLAAPELALVGAKVQAFEQLAAELVAGRHKALVFSQFTDFLDLLAERLRAAGIAHHLLTGGTPGPERTRRVAAFQGGEGDLFLISLKAGGFGLNLTAADYVIIADPWWNPAAEDQASGRAHRIGQQRPVTVYRLVTAGSIEERILTLHERKRELADTLLEGQDQARPIGADELRELLTGD